MACEAPWDLGWVMRELYLFSLSDIKGSPEHAGIGISPPCGPAAGGGMQYKSIRWLTPNPTGLSVDKRVWLPDHRMAKKNYQPDSRLVDT